jgi:molybdopterin-containing oxidoreductase family membrane subunit
MLELAIKGSKKYYGWMTALLTVIGVGFVFYLWQLSFGLGITGMSRDVSWGFYIAQFTFLVGVAASAVMVVLPYYLHDYKAYGRVTILGEFLAIASVLMCVTFILVDLGQPMRVFNVFLYPSPKSVLFWDTIVLNGYLFLNLVIGWNVLEAERNGVHYQKWLKPLIYISIPWAISIHTVTAMLYCGLPGRHFWLTAIGGNILFFPMHFVGLAGMPRRIPDYSLQFAEFNAIATVGAFIFGFSQLIFLYNVIKTIRGGEKATDQVWEGADGLEWTLPSPAPFHSFTTPPTVK